MWGEASNYYEGTRRYLGAALQVRLELLDQRLTIVAGRDGVDDLHEFLRYVTLDAYITIGRDKL